MSPDQVVERCRNLIARPLGAVAERWKADHPGGRAVAAYPVWAPAELIHAAGMLPLSLLGGGTSVELTHADARFQSFVCSIAKSTLELGFQGLVNGVDGLVFSSICDVARNLSSIYKRNFPGMFVDKVTFGDAQITEITCHARGAHSLFPATRTVIDMGGQDTKAIKVGPDGSVIDFSMNDKCAAGTGRFLSAAADVTGVGLEEIGPLSLQAKAPVRLTSVCTVFVESDIMSYLAQRKTIEDILGGVHKAIATRTMSLVRRVGVEEEITFTGGVSRNTGMVRGLEEVLGKPIEAEQGPTASIERAEAVVDQLAAALGD